MSMIGAKRSKTTCSTMPPKKRVKYVTDVADAGPTAFIREAFKENGFSTEDVTSVAKSRFRRPTKEIVESYTMEVSQAVRDDDLDKLRQLHESGALLDCCNQFGDSLVHIACRRGHTKIVKFLVEEVRASVHFVDDTNRTPLHDACWTSEPNFEIVDVLLRAAPEHCLWSDKRGATPFDYARSNNWAEWTTFLSERMSMFHLHKSDTQ